MSYRGVATDSGLGGRGGGEAGSRRDLFPIVSTNVI